MKYKWLPRPEKTQTKNLQEILTELSEPVKKIILRRGFDTEFLESDFTSLSAWDALPGALQASEILAEAIQKKQKIIVHGDFDADGVTSTALVVRVIRALGGDIDFHIPDRFTEGYGLTETGVNKCLSINASVLLTVDCGITANKEVSLLQDAGVKVIITDHHLPSEKLPEAAVIVNPVLSTHAEAPWSHLAGVGVVYFVLRGLCSKMGKPDLSELEPDIVAIGTICDMVSLTGDNRILVKEGLRSLRTKPSTGLKALLRKANIEYSKTTPRDIGFGIGPRINSAGRIAHADLSVKLLLEDETRFAEELALKLDNANKERRNLDSLVYSEAEKLLRNNNTLFAIADSSDWHAGVLGISASRLSRELGKPVLLVSWNDDIGKGSARGVPGMPVYSILSEALAKGLLLRFGGHAQATGLTVKREHFAAFRSFVEEEAEKRCTEIPRPVLFVDGRLTAENCDFTILKSLKRLEPFGTDNPEPVWIMRNIYPVSFRSVGADGRHLQVSFQENGVTLRGIGFGMGHRTSELNRKLDVAFTLSEDTFRANNTVQMIILDIKPAARKL